MHQVRIALTLVLCGCVGGIAQSGSPATDPPAGEEGVPRSPRAPVLPGAGGVGAPSVPMGGAPGPSACELLPPRAYRLTPKQIRRSLAALLGSAAPGTELESALHATSPDGWPFSNAEPVLSASPGFLEASMDGARAAATAALAAPAALHPCVAAGVHRACVGSVLETFGARAWRRPGPPRRCRPT